MIKNVLVDVDGVLWQGGKQIKGSQETLEFLKENKFSFLLLTNISRYTRKDLAKKLSNEGLCVSEQQIMGPIETTIEFLKSKKPFPTCYVIADPTIKKQFKQSGLKITEKQEPVDFVVVFLYEKTDYDSLDLAFRALLNGAQLVANTDLKHAPFRDKNSSLATGAFVKALEYSSGKRAFITGKPNAVFFRQALKKINAKPSETIMVGDNISTDILGAKKAGLKAILVRTGSYNEKELKKSVLKPDTVIDSIAELPRILQNSKL